MNRRSLPYIIVHEVKTNKKYNPEYGDDRICVCGHPYHRHFDSYEDMRAVGCKYCQCFEFIEDINKHGSIFTITTIPYQPQKLNRCVGYFFDKDSAIKEVINNSMDISEKGYYLYCVIEEVKQGIYFFPRMQLWFQWDSKSDLYLQLDEKPKRFNDIACFGIG